MGTIYTSIATEVKVGESSETIKGKTVKVALKEKISFLVPTLEFFADAIASGFNPEKQEYADEKAQWLFDAVVSKARQTLASRITTEGKIAWRAPYKPWSDFYSMTAVLGQRGRSASAEALKAFVTDFTAFLLTLGKSEKFVSQRVELVSNSLKLAAQNETVKSKVAEILGQFFNSLTEEQKEGHQSILGDLMALCSPEQLDDLDE